MNQNQLPVLPSPARLGLSNPHSPSLPTSTPPNPPPKHSHHHQRTSTLLSLLPPHSRAQSIIHHMASLTTKLFEVSTNKTFWFTSYRGSLPTFLPSQTLPIESSTASTTKEVLSLLVSLQTQLFEAVAELQEVIDIEEQKQKLTHEIQSKDSSILAFAKKVKEAEKVLELIVDDYEDYKQPKRLKSSEEGAFSVGKNQNTHLNLSDILSYAHRISYTTFAPPEFGAGLAPLRGALPPAPQEEQMRASQLYRCADLDVGLPKIESKEGIAEALFETGLPAEPAVDLKAIQGMLVPPPIPSGWRPGMPIELPSEMPLVPPGWKPGDPVPLPPMVEVPAGWKPGDAIVLPKPEEPLQLPPKPMGMPGAQPEPIQVRFVQLDINPDQDEYSSDYSSEEGSSEADDEE